MVSSIRAHATPPRSPYARFFPFTCPRDAGGNLACSISLALRRAGRGICAEEARSKTSAQGSSSGQPGEGDWTSELKASFSLRAMVTTIDCCVFCAPCYLHTTPHFYISLRLSTDPPPSHALPLQAIRAQLQDELLSLRSYVLRSEQTVQELQEQARRQAREQGRYTDSGGGDSSGRNNHRDQPFLAVADHAAAAAGLF